MKMGTFDTAERVLVVAEVGNNHEGDFRRACELVRGAAAAGADAVKFQTFRAERYVGRADPARYERLKSFELSPEQFGELSTLSRSLGMLFLSTPFDLESVTVLDPLVDGFKVSSGDNNLFPLLELVAATDKPLIVSTGLCGLDEVRVTADFLRTRRRSGVRDLALLHCVTSYPAPADQANLLSVRTLAEAFPDLTVGYSDHTLGIEACVLAVALGARVVEKHFTLDKDQSDFRDHKLSADPAELTELVRRVAAVPALLGRPGKSLQPCERDLLPAVRRSAAAAADLPAGHRLRKEDLMWLRPSGGVAPGAETALFGRTLTRALKRGERLKADDVD